MSVGAQQVACCSGVQQADAGVGLSSAMQQLLESVRDDVVVGRQLVLLRADDSDLTTISAQCADARVTSWGVRPERSIPSSSRRQPLRRATPGRPLRSDEPVIGTLWFRR